MYKNRKFAAGSGRVENITQNYWSTLVAVRKTADKLWSILLSVFWQWGSQPNDRHTPKRDVRSFPNVKLWIWRFSQPTYTAGWHHVVNDPLFESFIVLMCTERTFTLFYICNISYPSANVGRLLAWPECDIDDQSQRWNLLYWNVSLPSASL